VKIVQISAAALTAAQVHTMLRQMAPKWYARWGNNPTALQSAADLVSTLNLGGSTTATGIHTVMPNPKSGGGAAGTPGQF
jgi:hypothetical protein